MNKITIAFLSAFSFLSLIVAGYFLIKYPFDIPIFGGYRKVDLVMILCAFIALGFGIQFLRNLTVYPQRRPPASKLKPFCFIYIAIAAIWVVALIYTLIYGIIPTINWSLQN